MDLAVAELAARQDGVVTAKQLAELGLGRRGVAGRASAGRLHRVHRGVYAVMPVSLLRPRGQLRAAALALGPNAVLSMRSAAELHGLLSYHASTPYVTVAGAAGIAKHAGVHVNTSRTLRLDRDVTVVDGIPVTTWARTVLDLAGAESEDQLARILSTAEGAQLLDMVELNEQLDHNRRRSRNWRALTAVLARYEIGAALPREGLEQRFFDLLVAHGIPRPALQVWLDLGDGDPPIRADFFWREARVIIETDDRRTHAGWVAATRDRERDQRAAAAGYETVRVTWGQIGSDAAGVADRVARIVEDRKGQAPQLGWRQRRPAA